jgi:hypothetical protein
MKKHHGLFPAIALMLLLNGCASHSAESIHQGNSKKLSVGQIRELVNGSSVHLEGYGQSATVEFSHDGTLAGTNISGEKDTGDWQVKRGKLCLHFKKWGQGDKLCYLVEGSGSAYQLFNGKGMMIYDLTVLTPGGHEVKSDPQSPLAIKAADHPSSAKPEAPVATENLPITPQVAADLDFIIRQNAQNCPGCNLAHAHLAGQSLVGANLEGANLAEADLSHANLRRANLKGANLYRANLTGADLAGADLTGANLTEAIH